MTKNKGGGIVKREWEGELEVRGKREEERKGGGESGVAKL